MITVWANGCFDVLHIGHIALFEFAKMYGDRLIVGIDSDDRVKQLKGNSRPFNNLQDRIKMLDSIKYIDKVVSFSTENEMIERIQENHVDYIIVGNDYIDKKVVGSEVAKVIFFERRDGYSTTSILEGGL